MGGGIRWQGRAALLGAASLLVSCSAELYHKRADREAYSALFEKTTKVDNVSTGDVELTEPAELDLSSLRTKSTADEIMGKFADYEKGAKIMPLDVALETGIQRSRAYRSAKESLYLKALDLTLARHRLSPIFFTGGRINRWEGALFLLYFAADTAYLVMTASESPTRELFDAAMLSFVLPLTAITLVLVALRGWKPQGRRGA